MREWIKALPLSLGLPVVIAAASVKPEDAASNVASWVELLGFHNLPNWLTGPTADQHVIAAACLAAAVYSFAIWGPLRKKGAIVNTWGPWLLIIGGPALGFAWLYFQSPFPNAKITIPASIENRWTWAALTPSESDSLYEKLRGKEQYSFHIACNRPECSNLAISFDRLFKRLGWPSFVGDGGFLATGVTGILINPADAGAKLLKSAIETTTILRPDLGSLRGKDTTSPIMLVIGTKPEILATGPMQATKEPDAQASKPQLQPHATESKPSPPPSGVRKYAIDGLMNARDDLLSLKKENLSCDALSSWQARADAATRLAHANGIGVHNPISQYLGACKNITDVDLLDAIRGDIVRLLNQGIQGAGG